jgi:hypothetical protein
VHLKSIRLEGYRSARHGAAIVMDEIGRCNVLIGPNNSGKSTILRFLEVVASLASKGFELPIRLGWEQADRSWWWQGKIDHPIEATLIFSGPVPEHELDPSAPGRFENQGEWRVSITVVASPAANPQQCLVLLAPNVYLNGTWLPIARLLATNLGVVENLNRDGHYVSSSGTDACPYAPGGIAIFRAWAVSTRFYDPVRAIDRASGRRRLADGSELLKRIHDQQLDRKETHAFERFRGRLIWELNDLLFDPASGNPIESFEIKGTDDGLDLYVKRRGDEAPIALEYMGTGIAELTVLLADILQNEAVKQYFVEEPECHLHPGLLRRFIKRLRSISEAQFFITTHSNAVLDTITGSDSVYRFGIKNGSGTASERCSTTVSQGRILDELGVSGSTLLQTNCVLWVEGPSDRIYLAFWLGLKGRDRGLSYVEGGDFSFVFYGGKILNHFAFGDGGPENLISLIRVCRFSAVLMDKDIDPSDPTQAVRQTKSRVHAEAQSDLDHRRAIYTQGREIENDVDPHAFRRAAARVLNIDIERLSSLQISGNKSYADEVLEHLGLDAESAKVAARKLRDKVALAKAVTDEWTSDAVVPAYVDELLDLIGRSRLA